MAAKMPEQYDMVIVGAGPVGLMLAACLLRLGPYKIKHIDNRTEATQIGRADGIQARTIDVLHNMGLKRPIMAYNPGRIYEVAFWNSDGKVIQRTGTSKSYPDYIDTRYPFTTILHQGRIEKVFLDDLRIRGLEIQRPWTIRGFLSDAEENPEYPIEVDLTPLDREDRTGIVRTKYLFGADGAKSVLRDMLNVNMAYKDPTLHVWSVIDGVVKSDFPDMQVCRLDSKLLQAIS